MVKLRSKNRPAEDLAHDNDTAARTPVITSPRRLRQNPKQNTFYIADYVLNKKKKTVIKPKTTTQKKKNAAKCTPITTASGMTLRPREVNVSRRSQQFEQRIREIVRQITVSTDDSESDSGSDTLTNAAIENSDTAQQFEQRLREIVREITVSTDDSESDSGSDTLTNAAIENSDTATVGNASTETETTANSTVEDSETETLTNSMFEDADTENLSIDTITIEDSDSDTITIDDDSENADSDATVLLPRPARPTPLTSIYTKGRLDHSVNVASNIKKRIANPNDPRAKNQKKTCTPISVTKIPSSASASAGSKVLSNTTQTQTSVGTGTLKKNSGTTFTNVPSNTPSNSCYNIPPAVPGPSRSDIVNRHTAINATAGSSGITSNSFYDIPPAVPGPSRRSRSNIVNRHTAINGAAGSSGATSNSNSFYDIPPAVPGPSNFSQHEYRLFYGHECRCFTSRKDAQTQVTFQVYPAYRAPPIDMHNIALAKEAAKYCQDLKFYYAVFRQPAGMYILRSFERKLLKYGKNKNPASSNIPSDLPVGFYTKNENMNNYAYE